MRYVLTGGSGYIGRNLAAALLAAGHRVAFVLHTQDSVARVGGLLSSYPETAAYAIHDGSIESLSNVCAGADRVLHLGAYFSPRRDQGTVERLIESNVTLSSLLFCALADVAPQAPVICASTFSAFDGSGALRPVNFYSATKAAVETLATAFPMPFVFLRFTDSYGPGDPRPKVFSLARDAILRGEPFVFLSYPEQNVNVMRVDDVVRAVIHAASLPLAAGRIETYDLAYPENETTLGHLAGLLELARPEAALSFAEQVPLTALPPQAQPLPGFAPMSRLEADFVSSVFAPEEQLRAQLLDRATT
jgi:nucleoside-diphosphate-sugar epimerase